MEYEVYLACNVMGTVAVAVIFFYSFVVAAKNKE